MGGGHAGKMGDGKVPGRTIVVVQAHQDDADFYCGGSVARWCRQGDRVLYVTVTDGSKGTLDPEQDPAALAATRREEQQRAAEVLGVAECVFLGYPDGDLVPDLALREKLVAIFRRHRPDLLVTHDPSWKSYLLHPDHRATGEMAMYAALAAAMPLFHREHLDQGLVPHEIPEALLFHSPDPDYMEDVSDYVGIKVKALMCHQSQFYLLGQAEAALGISLDQLQAVFQRGPENLPVGVVKERFKRVPMSAGGPAL